MGKKGQKYRKDYDDELIEKGFYVNSWGAD